MGRHPSRNKRGGGAAAATGQGPRVTVRAPGKVNLQLTVGAPAADGFHPVATVFQAVSLFDDISAEATPEGSGITLDVVGEGVDEVPLDESNLAWRAAAALAAEHALPTDVHLTIRKGIPVAGGMAGGSADAAATLVACAALWELPTDRASLHAIAAALGSDVPFPLLGGTAIGTNRGDELTPALSTGTFHWVFALSERGLSTPAVYRRCDDLRGGTAQPPPRIDQRLMAALRAGDVAALAKALSNDLQAAALSLRPDLAALLDLGLDAGALAGLISGSGPTAAFLVSGEDAALDLTVSLSSSGMCRAVRYASGPAPGARIIDQAGPRPQ